MKPIFLRSSKWSLYTGFTIDNLHVYILFLICLFQVRIISQNAQNFVRKNLMPEDILCYHVKLFEVSRHVPYIDL